MISDQIDNTLLAESNWHYNTDYPTSVIAPDFMDTGAGLTGWKTLTESLWVYHS